MSKCACCNIETKNPKYCSLKCQWKHQSKNWLEKKLGVLMEFQVSCFNCKKPIIIKEYQKLYPKKEKYFCNRSCANKRTQTEETNRKRSITLQKRYFSTPTQIKETIEEKYKRLYNNNLKRKCPSCDSTIQYKTFYRLHRAETAKSNCKKCCVRFQKEKGHFSKMGRNSSNIQSKNRRSKNEILFANLCKEKFQNVKTNEPIFNGWDADIILPNEKIAILWNGKWHYEKLSKKHSVEQVQNRDKIKIDEITKLGYTYYIVKDMGGYNPSFVKSEFEKFCSFTI